MGELDVRIESLPAMRVASFHAVSARPEADAWAAMTSWAKPRGLLDDPSRHPVFGFNNPNPSPGRQDYGYELWLRVESDFPPHGSVVLKDVPPGHFAVFTHHGVPNPEIWKLLWDWVQRHGYRWSGNHELERIHDARAVDDQLVFDLYLPIES